MRALTLVLLIATLAGRAGAQTPSWRLAYSTESPNRLGLDGYVASVPNGKPRRIAGVAGRDEFSPAWSPNGKLIAYRRNPPRGNESDIMVVAATGGRPRNLTNSPGVAE